MGWSKLEAELIEMEEPKVSLFRLSGGLTGSSESYEFLDLLREQVRKHPAPVVLSLRGVEHANSAGVGILAACYTSVTNASQKICLAEVPNRLKAILDVVKLSDCLCILPTEEEAIGTLTD
jgi:anti-anti-sigma factor